MKLKTLLVAACCIVLSAGAHAEMLYFAFDGVVTAATPMAPKGAAVTGTFSYNTSTNPKQAGGDPDGPGSGWASYERLRHTFSMQVNGHTISNDWVNVYITNNYDGNVQDCFVLSVPNLTLDGTLFKKGYASINLCSAIDQLNVLQDTQLPTLIAAKRFKAWRTGSVYMSANPQPDVLLEFRINNISTAMPADK